MSTSGYTSTELCGLMQFEVPDSTCSCYWDGGNGAGPNKDTFVDNGCQKSGYHQYSAHL